MVQTNFKIIAVGKLRERYWQDAASDYVKRLNPYVRINIIEIPEAHVISSSTAKDGIILHQEALGITSKLRSYNGTIVALDRNGSDMDSKRLADWIAEQMINGKGDICWIIGGPIGLAPEILSMSHLQLSFSKMTFPHQMMRVILLEQIYRAFRIIKAEPYHK